MEMYIDKYRAERANIFPEVQWRTGDRIRTSNKKWPTQDFKVCFVIIVVGSMLAYIGLQSYAFPMAQSFRL